MLRQLRFDRRTVIGGAFAVALMLASSSDAFAQGGGQGGGGGGLTGGGGGLTGGGGFGGQGGGIFGTSGGTGSTRNSYVGARPGFRPSWITATARTGTTGGQFGQLGGQQFGGQFGGQQFGGQLGRTGTGTIPRVTGSMVQDTMKPLPPAVTEMKGRIERLLAVSAGTEGARQINFDLEEDFLVMRGDVPTEQERRLAESLLLLEPGVGKVKNELTVAGRPRPTPPPPRTTASGP